MKNKNLKEKYNTIINKYIKAFEKKHEIYLEYWVADEIGGICEMGDYFFNFEDIKRDIDENVQKDIIFDWYDYNVENENEYVNYKSWLMGYDKIAKEKIITKEFNLQKKLTGYILQNMYSKF